MKQPIRKARRSYNEPGHAHFVTYSCFRRLPLLNSDRARRWVIDALEAVRRNLDVALWAYVVMPEHVHLLLFPQRPDYQMRQILAALKRPVSGAARDHLKRVQDERWLRRLTVEHPSRRVFRFWQPGGGFDRNIFGDMSIPEVVDYIHENPVRRGLVSLRTDWEWSSARFWDGWTDVPIRTDQPVG